MKKWMILCGCLLAGSGLWSAGLDFEIFGWKIFDFSFDVSPFSRDNGRAKVYTPSHAPGYYAIPNTVTAPVIAASPTPPVPAPAVVPPQNVSIANSENVQIVIQQAAGVQPPPTQPRVIYGSQPPVRYYYTYYPSHRYVCPHTKHCVPLYRCCWH